MGRIGRYFAWSFLVAGILGLEVVWGQPEDRVQVSGTIYLAEDGTPAEGVRVSLFDRPI